jgi:hypothetical protein
MRALGKRIKGVRGAKISQTQVKNGPDGAGLHLTRIGWIPNDRFSQQPLFTAVGVRLLARADFSPPNAAC